MHSVSTRQTDLLSGPFPSNVGHDVRRMRRVVTSQRQTALCHATFWFLQQAWMGFQSEIRVWRYWWLNGYQRFVWWYKLPWRCGEQASSKRNLYTNTGSVISRNLQLFRNKVRRFSTKSAILRAPHCFLFCHLPLQSNWTASKKYRPLERKKIVVRCRSVPNMTSYLTVCTVYHVVRRSYTALICTASHLEENRPYELI